MTTSIVLTGLDGSNPLGFLAALGVLAAADTVALGSRLSWTNEGRWRPRLTSPLDRVSLLECLVADLRTWDDDRAVRLSYEKSVKEGAKKTSSEPKVTLDLKPKPTRFRQYLKDLVKYTYPDQAHVFGEEKSRESSRDLIEVADTAILPAFLQRPRRPLDYASAFGTEVAVDNNKNVKPTALHFTAGQQEFLKSVLELIEGVNNTDLEEAVFGPWQYRREMPVLSWDSSVSRDYALRADDPSKSKKTGVPGADWLAFRGLVFVPVAPVGSEIQTAGCSGGWKHGGAFAWPLWSGALSVSAVRSIMTFADLVELNAHERRARGIEAVLRSGIRRSDQGGYGSFLPADVRPPGKR